MNKHGLTKENLAGTLPPALRTDPSVVALAEALAELLAARPAEIDRLRIYPAIDTLDEPLLDILAHDFKVDWWDPEYSLEEKRQTMKGSWYVHKKLGTAGAVKRAIRAIYPEAVEEPWFVYGGEPYHYRLRIDLTQDPGDLAKRRRVLERVAYYQSLRDRLDEVKYTIKPEKAWAGAGGAFAGSRGEVHAMLTPPPLVRPGGRAAAHAGGALVGTYRRLDAAPAVPPLARPEGKAGMRAGAVSLGTVQRESVAVRSVGGIAPPAGRGGAGCRAGVFHAYAQVAVNISAWGRDGQESKGR